MGAVSIHDFEPITGRLHQPPPVHQTFAGDGWVLCSFVPRLYDFHPDAVPAPYNHSNVMSDEVLYYCNDEFMSRKGIEFGSLTLHPDGLPHGPQPGKTEASIGKKETHELAVMVDTFAPLRVGRRRAAPARTATTQRSWLEGIAHDRRTRPRLLAGLIDYAGLSRRRACRYRKAVADVRAASRRSRRPWMLGTLHRCRPRDCGALGAVAGATARPAPAVAPVGARQPSTICRRVGAVRGRINRPRACEASRPAAGMPWWPRGRVPAIRAHLAALVAAVARAGLGGRELFVESPAGASDDPDTRLCSALWPIPASRRCTAARAPSCAAAA